MSEHHDREASEALGESSGTPEVGDAIDPPIDLLQRIQERRIERAKRRHPANLWPEGD